jgi:diadenosine tetraphosphate (Ap4A) HIT family hydrolase
MACPFCNPDSERITRESDLAFALRDGFPVSKGHMLVIPKRHIASFFDLTDDEYKEIRALLIESKKLLDHEFSPDGYNIGVNDGPAAGQTVPHLHFHLIPRYQGDREDPRGGIRWILPEKADYWSKK